MLQKHYFLSLLSIIFLINTPLINTSQQQSTTIWLTKKIHHKENWCMPLKIMSEQK